MKYDGIILRVQRARDGVTLIVETVMGLRGVELDPDLWQEIMTDFQLEQADDVIGWRVEYDPAHGDLEIIGPAPEDYIDDDDDEQGEGYDDHDDERTA